MSRDKLSTDSLAEASRERAKFSGHGNALGAAGYTAEGEAAGLLSGANEIAVINPQTHGFQDIRIAVSWNNVVAQKGGFLHRLLCRVEKRGVDLDLGCLYELQDGSRGALQAFGDMYGAYNDPPYIRLSGDERTGDREGDDEYITIHGQKWPLIKRLLLYVYIYGGVPAWAEVRPQVRIAVPGEEPLTVVPSAHDSVLAVCALASLENVRDGIKITNHTEYFPGHAEMDRAFGFGGRWEDGIKQKDGQG